MYMNKLIKKQLILILFTVVLVGTLIVTTSFAVFEDTKSNAQDQKMAVGDLNITFTGGSAINITNLSPMTDTVAKSQTNNLYTFSIANTGTVPYKFTVKLENNPSYTSNLLPHKYIRYSLNNAAVKFVSDNTGLLVEGMIEAGVTNNYSLRLWVADAETYKLPDSTLGQEIHLKINVDGKAGIYYPPAPDGWYDASSGTLLAAIKKDNTVTETLTQPGIEPSAHILDDVQAQTESVSSTCQAYYITYGTGWEANGTKFNLTGTAVTSNKYANSYSTLVGKYLTSDSLYSAGSNIAGTMKTTTNLSAVYYVTSATSSSFTYKILSSNKNITEALLASTEDDYGTSYYFRGTVKNNYVEYANMCWRIVRVTGDGSIKLVLYNYNRLTDSRNTPSSSTPCNVTGDDLSLARYEGDTYNSEFNSSDNDNAYIGLMYGTAGASNYAAAHANTNPSTILTNLNKWYTNVLSKQSGFKESQLADTIWCNDKSVVTDTTYNPDSWTLGTNYGYGTNKNYYSATKRLKSTSDSAGGTGPSLICPNDNNGGKLSKFTVSDTVNGNGALSGYAKIGLLTADEIAFAGGGYGTSNSAYYINGNTNSTGWWGGSLSPIGFRYSSALVWSVDGIASYLGYSTVTDGGGVRPSLSLNSKIKISSGVGSATNPYKIAA